MTIHDSTKAGGWVGEGGGVGEGGIQIKYFFRNLFNFLKIENSWKFNIHLFIQHKAALSNNKIKIFGKSYSRIRTPTLCPIQMT